MPRRKKEEDERTVLERQQNFLRAYANCFSIDRAAEQARVDRSFHFRWFRKSRKYAELFEKIKANAANYLETEAITRAGEGWEEDVYYQGNVCGTVRRFDSGLTQFLLRGMMPHKYGSKTEISGPEGAPLQAKIEVVFVRPDDTSGDPHQG
jgi:hypothetical protein